MKHDLKQTMRRPVSTVLFLLLLIASASLISIGGNLWFMNSKSIRYYEKNFFTVGTVEQLPGYKEQNKLWDAEKRKNIIYQVPGYDRFLLPSVLEFPGADYLCGPEKRPWYGSYAPQYKLKGDGARSFNWILEFTPLEDCIPDEPVQVRVQRVLWGDDITDEVIWFWERFEPDPGKLYKGKCYVVALEVGMSADGDLEYTSGGIQFSQFTADGIEMPDSYPEIFTYLEVTDGFYESEAGKKMLEYTKTLEMNQKTQRVMATNKTIFLMPFYQGEAFVKEGRDISEEEYIRGDKICLISKNFAESNGLILGDPLRLQLYYADYKRSSGEGFSPLALNAVGKAYSVFEDDLYQIVGMYELSPGVMQGEYGMVGDEVIIPINAVKGRDRDNIVNYGIMKGSTTSFQIANGRIEEFMEGWEAYGMDELKILFYDMGYSKLKDGLERMKHMSVSFLVAGVILMLLILSFYIHAFLSRQKQEIAIKYSLGISKRRCAASIMAILMLILTFGTLIGCGVGGGLSRNASAESFHQTYYNAAYGSQVVEAIPKENQKQADLTENIWLISGIIGAVILVTGGGMVFYQVRGVLKYEPMQLLGQQED